MLKRTSTPLWNSLVQSTYRESLSWCRVGLFPLWMMPPPPHTHTHTLDTWAASAKCVHGTKRDKTICLLFFYSTESRATRSKGILNELQPADQPLKRRSVVCWATESSNAATIFFSGHLQDLRFYWLVSRFCVIVFKHQLFFCSIGTWLEVELWWSVINLNVGSGLCAVGLPLMNDEVFDFGSWQVTKGASKEGGAEKMRRSHVSK